MIVVLTIAIFPIIPQCCRT